MKIKNIQEPQKIKLSELNFGKTFLYCDSIYIRGFGSAHEEKITVYPLDNDRPPDALLKYTLITPIVIEYVEYR